MTPRTEPAGKFTFACVFILIGIVGCQQPAQPDFETAALIAVSDETEYDRLWNDCTSILRRYEMIPDRQDRTAGVITTRPTVSAHWFEVWRQDVVTPWDFAASNLASYRKSARVMIDATTDPNEYVLAVRVNVERYTSPERQVNATAGAYQIFGTQLPSSEGDLLRDQITERWIPKGRDAALEEVILARIIDRFNPANYEMIEYVTEEADDDASDVPVIDAPTSQQAPRETTILEPVSPNSTQSSTSPPPRRPAQTGPIQQVTVQEVR